MDMNTILETLGKLDPSTDAHWTKGGLPDLNAVREIAGEYVSRKACSAARPGFTRDVAKEDRDGKATATEPVTAKAEGAGAQAEPSAEGTAGEAPSPAPNGAKPVEPRDVTAKPVRRGFRYNWG